MGITSSQIDSLSDLGSCVTCYLYLSQVFVTSICHKLLVFSLVFIYSICHLYLSLVFVTSICHKYLSQVFVTSICLAAWEKLLPRSIVCRILGLVSLQIEADRDDDDDR